MSAHKENFNADPTDRVQRNFEICTEIVRTLSIALGTICNYETSAAGAAKMKHTARLALIEVNKLADSIDVVIKKSEVRQNAKV